MDRYKDDHVTQTLVFRQDTEELGFHEVDTGLASEGLQHSEHTADWHESKEVPEGAYQHSLVLR